MVAGEDLTSDQKALIQFGFANESTISNLKVWLFNNIEITINNTKNDSVIYLNPKVRIKSKKKQTSKKNNKID